MRVKHLSERITVQRATSSLNNYNEEVKTWATLCSSWAEVRVLSGKELEAVQQTFSDVRFRVKIRFRQDVSIAVTDRISWGSRTLEILSCEDMTQESRYTEMLCKEIV